jgi:hypothetical protein
MFDEPVDPDTTWLACPYCHEVNPQGLIIGGGHSAGLRGILGLVLTLIGALGVTTTEFDAGPLNLIWLAGALALIIAGIRMLLGTDGDPRPATAIWGRWRTFFALLLLGTCAWISVIAVTP